MTVLTRHWLLSLWIVLCCFCAQGQQLLFSNPFKNILIPSQECYNIMQDSRGDIWFSTEAGVCRYDGTRLKVFDRKNGLPDEAVYAMTEDKDGTIWMATSESNIMCYRNGAIQSAPFEKAYRKIVERDRGDYSSPYPYFLDASQPGKLYVSHRFFTVSVDLKANTVEELKTPLSNANFVFARYGNLRYVPFVTKLGNASDKEIGVRLNGDKGSLFCKVSFGGFQQANQLSWYIVSARSGKTDFVSAHDQLLKLENGKYVSLHTFPDRIISAYIDKRGGLWVGVYKNGVFYYPDIKTMELGHHSMRAYSVSGIVEDHEKGVWCTTLERGVFYVKNKDIVAFIDWEGLNRRSTALTYTGGKLFASSDGTALFVADNGVFRKIAMPYPRESEIWRVLFDGQYWNIGGPFFLLHSDASFFNLKKDKFSVREGEFLGIQEIIKADNTLFSCIYQDVYRRVDDRWDLFYRFRDNIRCLSEGSTPGTLLMGGTKGLYEATFRNPKPRKIDAVKGNVVKILKDQSGLVWIITKQDGVYWYNGDKITRAGKELNLSTRFFFDITEDESGTIWLASNNGLFRIKRKSGSYEVKNYTTRNGLLSNEVYKVAADKRHLYFSTFEGLCRFPLITDLTNTTPPAIHLHSLTVNDKAREYAGPLKLGFHERTLRFIFDIQTFKNSPEPNLSYTLELNGESSSKKILGTELLFENLVQGSYKLKVYGINNDRLASAKPLIFFFEIERPYWQKWWFIAIEALVLILVIYLSIRLIARRIRKREEAKTELNKLMAEYQMTALQAQMNPHFIFNAINTIQGYILNKNEQEAYNYLAKFSRLIRMVLHHSQERMHSLDQELEVLNLYIELEQLRFDNRFDYQLDIDTDIELHDCFLPGMLLQPYVENAIWHGLINLESRRGRLLVQIVQEGELLKIVIEDNGVGREVAKSFRKDRLHQSMAMKLNEQRLMVLNKLHGFEQASVTVTDLCDAEDNPIGTRVEVVIPVN